MDDHPRNRSPSKKRKVFRLISRNFENQPKTGLTDAILESDGRLCPLEIKKTALPDKRLTRAFGVIDKSPLTRGTGAILCMADHFSALDRENLIVPIWMI